MPIRSFCVNHEVLASSPGSVHACPMSLEYKRLFASRERHLTRSTVRELLKLIANPEMISFAGGLPAPELLPVEAAREACARVLAHDGARALQYGETEGVAELRDWIAERYSTAGARRSREDVLIVSGSQQGLDLIGRVLLDAGDVVIVENPTYLAMLSAFRLWDVTFAAIASDEFGMRVDSIASRLTDRAKLVYAIPNFQNPQGTTLARERRQRLVELAVAHHLPIVEDDPYGALQYEQEAYPSLLELAAASGHADHVIRLGTFSKILAPGLRVGWVLGAAELIDKLVQAKQAADLHTSTFNQYIVWEMLRAGTVEAQLPTLRAVYRERRDAMLAALASYFPRQATWTQPAGGMFVMVRLPSNVDTRAILPRALERGVAFVPGADFHLNGEGCHTMRLNFSGVTPERIRLGMERLGALLAECLSEARAAPAPDAS